MSSTVFSKTSNRHILYGTCSVLLLLLLFFSLFRTVKDRDASFSQGMTVLSEGWYQIRNNEKKPISAPGTVEAAPGEELMIYNDTLRPDNSGDVVSVHGGALFQVKILLNDDIIYSYDDALFPRNRQMKEDFYCDVVLPPVQPDSRLTLICSVPDGTSSVFRVPSIYIGSSGRYPSWRTFEVVFSVLNILLLLSCCLVFTIILIYLYTIKIFGARFLSLAVFMWLSGIWCVFFSPLFRQSASLYASAGILSSYAFMLMFIPLFDFIRITADIRRQPAFLVTQGALLLNALGQGVLHYFFNTALSSMYWITHLLILLSFITVFGLLLSGYRKMKHQTTLDLMIALGFLIAGGSISAVLYWAFQQNFAGLLLQVEIFIFILLLFRSVARVAVRSYKPKQQVLIYQQISREDALTGLANRRAFDDLLSEVEECADTHRNAALIFMDLNNLKYVNDSFGHKSGDELIIAAAECIKSIFLAIGSCHRIGGDEFCVVILNPIQDKSVWLSSLQAKVNEYNAGSTHPLSIACGVSYLRRDDGSVKSISDWKLEADAAMYQDKLAWKAKNNRK